ncbi:Helix-turn-helix domain of resolvase [[Ruminococcus] gnavus]|uniref:Helix-turn-helix domain of resolvase n=1 Tax=Mediterraneibacter gnavus TaxID=33038 RepID=A0A6N3C4T0_MEDGN
MIKILYEDRKIIEEMYNSQMPINRIADRINVARSTLYRELRRGGVTEPMSFS